VIKGRRVLAVSLARGGSKSIPKKNIALICGRPLISYTIDAARQSQYIDDFIVSTDDEEIAAVASKLGADVPFRRPPELSTDTASSAGALCHAVLYMEQLRQQKYDIIVELMVTNPLKTSEQIDTSVEMLHARQADSVIAVTQVWDQHPARIKKIEDGRILDFCIHEPREMRRQDLTPSAYVRCGSIYTLNRDYLLATRNRYGSDKSYALIIPEDESVNIDSVTDFQIAELRIARRLASHKLRAVDGYPSSDVPSNQSP
jgi:N-acylneuraminate cytidylyltransferase